MSQFTYCRVIYLPLDLPIYIWQGVYAVSTYICVRIYMYIYLYPTYISTCLPSHSTYIYTPYLYIYIHTLLLYLSIHVCTIQILIPCLYLTYLDHSHCTNKQAPSKFGIFVNNVSSYSQEKSPCSGDTQCRVGTLYSGQIAAILPR